MLTKRMKILFKYPTRARPNWFKNTLLTYYGMMSKYCDFEFLVTCDIDDDLMNNPTMRAFMDKMPNLVYSFGSHSNKIAACNADMELVKDWDILVLVSDDMIPAVKNFDNTIVQMMKMHYPDTDGALHFNDGFLGKDRTITLSIMGRKMYERFDYVYHPDYKSFFCDNEFTDVVYALKRCHYDSFVVIKHEWKGDGKNKDDLYRRNSSMGSPDKVTYQRRKAAGFPK